PAPLNLTVGPNGQRSLNWPLVPALEELKLSRGSDPGNLNLDLTPGINKTAAGYLWSESNAAPSQYYGLRVGQMNSNALLNTTLLYRLAYGPTPDELSRLTNIGPNAYIAEQLAPENNPEALDDRYISAPGNGIFVPTTTDWVRVVATGTMTSNTLYI